MAVTHTDSDRCALCAESFDEGDWQFGCDVRRWSRTCGGETLRGAARLFALIAVIFSVYSFNLKYLPFTASVTKKKARTTKKKRPNRKKKTSPGLGVDPATTWVVRCIALPKKLMRWLIMEIKKYFFESLATSPIFGWTETESLYV